MAILSNLGAIFRGDGLTLDIRWLQDVHGIVDIKINGMLWNPDGYQVDGVTHTGNFDLGQQTITVYGLSSSASNAIWAESSNSVCTVSKLAVKEWVIEFGTQIPVSVYYLLALVDKLTGKTSYIEDGTKFVVVF